MEEDYSYVSVLLRDDMVEDVYREILEAGCAPSDKHDLHVTLMYDERPTDVPRCLLNLSGEFTAKIIGMGKLGDAYVFHLTSPQLLEEFRLLKESGYVHSYGTPMFHMSVGYKLSPHDELALDQVFATWMGKELVFGRMAFGVKKDK